MRVGALACGKEPVEKLASQAKAQFLRRIGEQPEFVCADVDFEELVGLPVVGPAICPGCVYIFKEITNEQLS